MADLSLTDALNDSVPDVEKVVERDFVATLEAESFDDQVGEMVGKTDYIPLLDNDGKGESDLLNENIRHVMQYYVNHYRGFVVEYGGGGVFEGCCYMLLCI